MFQIKLEHIRRLTFATKLFPKLNSAVGLDTSKLKSTDQYDGELFCGGRSTNKDLLTFFSFISDPTNVSTFVQLPTFRRSLRKLINLVEFELEAIGGQEVLVPTLVPQKLWKKSKRLERHKDALDNVYHFTDKGGNQLLLGPTFEETITKLVAGVESIYESELPILLFQTSSKFRFEPVPRFGLLRSNEFCMNDLYSFDASLEKATETYKLVSEVYAKIFKRLQLNCLKIESEPGNIGGRYSHEYQLPVSSGEDTIIRCNTCNQAYNNNLYHEKQISHNSDKCIKCSGTSIEKTKALELGHTFLLSNIYSEPLKAKYTKQDNNARVSLEMGCYGLGLTRILGAGVDLLSIIPKRDNQDENLLQIRWPTGVEPYKLGVVIPAKRSKQHNAGSTEFIEGLVNRILDETRNIDIIVEDRDKDGIGRRLKKLQSIGIPNIIIIGQRFLQDQPEIEMLSLDANKKNYEQNWFSQEQLCDYLKKLDTSEVSLV